LTGARAHLKISPMPEIGATTKNYDHSLLETINRPPALSLNNEKDKSGAYHEKLRHTRE
jgi:hypothetical protein